jgi:hypothetical protein
MNVSPENKAHAVGLLCTLFAANCFPARLWVELFPMEVILYGLLETVSKRRRAPEMHDYELEDFATHIMRRRQRQLTAPQA